MKYYFYLFFPIFLFVINIGLCQQCSSTSNVFIATQSFSVIGTIDSIHPNDICDYLFCEDISSDTLCSDFEIVDDYGPVYLSEDDLKKVICAIKRGNIKAYKLLWNYYWYNSQHMTNTDLDKLICITDFLAQKYFYHLGYLFCANFIFDHITIYSDDYYVSTMITYYEKFYDYSHWKDIANILYDFYCGKYSFCDKDSVKAKYYENCSF